MTRALAVVSIVVGFAAALTAGTAALALSIGGSYAGDDVTEARLLLLLIGTAGLALLVVGRKALR